MRLGRKLTQTKSQGDPMFEQSLLKEGKLKGSALGLSFLFQIGALGVALAIPMVFFDIVPLKELRNTTIFLPKPPAPPPPPPLARTKVPPQKVPPKTFQIPTPNQIPKDITVINDKDNENLPPTNSGPRIPGAIPCGTPLAPPCPKDFGTGPGDGKIVVAGPPAPPPPPKPETPKPPSQIRVGGDVQAANLLRKVDPPYPPLARATRVQGLVRFTAVIGKDGTIQNLQLVSGHPLLVEAARIAILQWLYKPTLLNKEPTEVITQIDVNFKLSI